MTPNNNSQHFRRIESIGNCPRLLSTFTHKTPITKHCVWCKSVAPTRHMLSQQKKRSISLVNIWCRNWFSESNPLNRPYLWPCPLTVTGKCEGTTPNVLSRCLISCSHVMACTSLALRRTQRKNGSNSGYPAVSKFLEASAASTLVGSISSKLIILRTKANWIRLKIWQRALWSYTWLWLNGSIGICSNIPVPSNTSIGINANEKFPLEQHSRSQKLHCCSDPSIILNFNHMERPIYWSNFDIKYWFQAKFSVQYFLSIDGVQRLSRSLPSALSLCGIPTAGLFFLSSGLNRGI